MHIRRMKFVLQCYFAKMRNYFERLKFRSNLRVDKTCFLRPGHILFYCRKHNYTFTYFLSDVHLNVTIIGQNINQPRDHF